MNRITERYWFRAKVLHYDPKTNPENGWVQGFYYQDLCGGEIKHFIRSGEMVWEIDPKTLGMFTGFYDNSTEPQPIFEGDILHTLFKENGSSYDLVGWNPKNGCFGIMDDIDYNARMEGEEDYYSYEVFAWMHRKKVQSVVAGNIHENADLMTQ